MSAIAPAATRRTGAVPGSGWPLRVYLVGLAVVFIVTAGVGALYEYEATAGDARSSAVADARFGARIGARDIAAGIGLVRSQLAQLAATPGITGVFTSPAGCSLRFGGAGAFTAGHIDIVARNGAVACTSLQSNRRTGYRGARWLSRAVRSAVFSYPVRDPRTASAGVVVAVPLSGHGAIVAFLGLDSLGRALTASDGGPRRLQFVVTTTDGRTILASAADPARWVGARAGGTAFAHTASVAVHAGLDGTQRIFTSARVPGLGWRVFAGADKAAALAAASHQSRRELAVILGGLAVFLAALWVIHRRIVRPIRELSAGIRAAATHQPARLPESGPAEVTTLTSEFQSLLAAAERELELAERLRQSERLESLGQLAAGIAHDFNNLLSVIINSAAFVAEAVADNETARADAEQIRTAGERAARLTKQLLIFGRRHEIHPELLDVGALVTGMQHMLERSLGERVHIVVRGEPGLPPVEADRGQLEQVVLNLAINARDAMPGGGVLTMETSVVELGEADRDIHPGLVPGRYVQLAVSDTGTGISPDVIPRLFEPFFTTKPHGEGTGLGLATVYGIAAEYGGTVDVESEEEAGTTFRVYLPTAESTARPAVSKIITPGASEAGQTILVVEDEAAMLEITSRILRRRGYQVLAASTAEQAIALATRNDFHLLLTDSVLPHASGATLTDEIERIRAGRPVVFMSGYSDGTLARQRIAARNAPILQKPFSAPELLESVQTALAKDQGR